MSKKNKWVLLLVTILAISTIALGGYIWLEQQKMKKHLLEVNAGASSELAVEIPAPIYYQMETFTLSLKPSEKESRRVLYIGLTLKLKDEKSKENIEKFLPDIRSGLLVLFSQQSANELSTDEAKPQLAEKIKEQINQPKTNHEHIQVTDVLFNAFILR
ncbi:flagellar basal body-associated protein FliL [Yersinia sp. HM-2024]|uniref:flagellar basal body-associated protein FliL n=1 Tax=Yersinia sp. HM-2024 TaxID=3344550 RepID=UPI00370DB994